MTYALDTYVMVVCKRVPEYTLVRRKLFRFKWMAKFKQLFVASGSVYTSDSTHILMSVVRPAARDEQNECSYRTISSEDFFRWRRQATALRGEL